MGSTYTELQLDALRELGNIGSGTAATALSSMLGKPIDITVPSPLVLTIADAVETVGAPDDSVTAVAIPIAGGLGAVVLMLFTPATAGTLCAMLGVEADSEYGLSALCEIGNILASSYIGALGTVTGLELEPSPPQPATDMLGAILASVLLAQSESDTALLIDSKLMVEGAECSPTFLFIPNEGGVGELLARLGLPQ